MPDLPEGRVSIADIVRITGYPRSYIVRLLDVPDLRTYLEYDENYPPSYPAASVAFFRWVNSEARPSRTQKGFEKATASNVMQMVQEYTDLGRPGVAENVLPEVPLADRTTDHKVPYGDNVPAVPQESPGAALMRAIEAMPDALGQAVLGALAVRESPPADDDWLTPEEAAQKLGGAVKPRSVSRYVKPIVIGGKRRYSLIMIRQHMEQQRQRLQGE